MRRGVGVSFGVCLGLVAGLVVGLFTSTAGAGPIACPEGASCGWSMSVNGAQVASGQILVDAEGNLSTTPMQVVGTDWTIGLDGLGGHVDPSLLFSASATNSSYTSTNVYSFSFSMPLGGLAVPISSFASLGITLTAASDAPGGSGSVFPILTGSVILDSQDIRLSPFQNVDKGVDLVTGSFSDGAGGFPSFLPLAASGSIVSGGPFDLMTVTLAFGLTPRTSAGFSGEVTQVPESATALLLGIGLVAIASRRRPH